MTNGERSSRATNSFKAWRGMPVLDPKPLDQLGRALSGLRKLLAHPLTQRCCERVHLADGGLAGSLFHGWSEARKPMRNCT